MGRQFSTRTRRSNINMASFSSVILAIFLASIIDLTTSKPQPQSYEVLDCPAVRPDLGSACSYQEEELELVCDYGVNECCGKAPSWTFTVQQHVLNQTKNQPKNLLKNLTKNLAINLAINLAKNLARNLAKNLARNQKNQAKKNQGTSEAMDQVKNQAKKTTT